MNWSKKKVDAKNKQIEFRASTDNHTGILLVVGLDGWDYKRSERRDPPKGPYYTPASTRGYIARLSMNGPAFLTKADLGELILVIEDAEKDLLALDSNTDRC